MLRDLATNHQLDDTPRELTIDELESVSGGTTLPPGDGCCPHSSCPC
jgi:bacteriocin-like protein